MIAFSNPLALLLLIPLVAVTLFAWLTGSINLSGGRRKIALGLRLTIFTALILGVAGAQLRLPQSDQAVVFVGDLSASDAGQRSQVQSMIDAAARGRPGNDMVGVVDVGRQPVVEQPLGSLTGFSGFQASVDPQYTNLESGLDLATAMLPQNDRRRVVLVSDGQQNVGDALSAARLLHSQGVRVDVTPLRVRSGPEVSVDRVDAPSQIRAHESSTLTVTVRSTITTSTGISVFRDGSLVSSRKVSVHPGVNRFAFAEGPLSPGFHTYRVQIAPDRDTQPENNSGAAYTSVQGAPTVLVIAARRGEATNVMASLASTGIKAVLQAPGAVPAELGYLQRYAAMVVVDTAADELGANLMAQFVPYVRDMGHGLVVIGGQNAYGMGGYSQTPLERVLPVSMEIPKRTRVPSTAVVLIIESLEEDSQINISKEAGKGVVDLLGPQDQVAVNDAPFDGSAGWIVPMQHVTDKAAIGAAIDRMQPGDPLSYSPSLVSAYNVLRHTRAQTKHIILLGDGDAEDPTYQQLVTEIRARGITVSTVATSGLGRNDYGLMQNLARWGGGRYYRADDPAQIPQIFLRETRSVARFGIVPGKFYPEELSANPMVKDLRSVAPLFGYVATTPKPAGEIVLASKKLDPILAAWQLGLGRSVAWTSDAAGLWTQDWLRAPGANRFWADLVSWVLPASGSGSLYVAASISGGTGHLSVSTPSSLGPAPDVTAKILDPSLHSTSVQLEPSAPGQFVGSFPVGLEGSYFVTLEARGDGHADAGQVGIAVPYSAEYRTSGVDMPFLRSVAAAGGGGVLTRAQDVWKDNLPTVWAPHALSTWLWLLALLLIPVDVGVRRLMVGRKQLAEILSALLPGRQSAPKPEPAVAALGALRAQRAQRAAIPVEPLRAGATAMEGSPRPATGRWKGSSRSQHPLPPASGHAGDGDSTQPAEQTTMGRLLASRRKREP